MDVSLIYVGMAGRSLTESMIAAQRRASRRRGSGWRHAWAAMPAGVAAETSSVFT